MAITCKIDDPQEPQIQDGSKFFGLDGLILICTGWKTGRDPAGKVGDVAIVCGEIAVFPARETSDGLKHYWFRTLRAGESVTFTNEAGWPSA